MTTPAFSSDDLAKWGHIDVTAIVERDGIATVRSDDADTCLDWLRQKNYIVASLDCSTGFVDLTIQLDRLFCWRKQFGYDLVDRRRDTPHLDALEDGFRFDIPEEKGLVLQLIRPDVLWKEDAQWTSHFLSIASRYSRWQLAVGHRFFALLVLPADSDMIGKVFWQAEIPIFGWNRLKA